MKRNHKVTALFAATAVALGAGACVFNNRTGSKPIAKPQGLSSAGTPIVTPPARRTQKSGDSQEVTIYEVALNEDGSYLETHTVVLPASANTPQTRAVAAFAAMEKLPAKVNPLPHGAKALSVAFGDDGVATVDFNRALQTNFVPGDQNEALAINTILATVGQFPGVEKVQITVEGEKIKSLGGTQKISKPLPIPQDVARNSGEQKEN